MLEIYNEVIANTTAVYDFRPHGMDSIKRSFEDKTSRGMPVIVAEADGKIAGYANYGPFRNWAAYRYSVEHSLYVHKDCRGRGISKLLLAELIRIAKENEVKTMIGGIDSGNEVSIGLHEKFGFRECGRIRQVGYKFGKWLDLVFMQLLMDGPIKPKEE